MLGEALGRAISRLQVEHVLPETLSGLEFPTNIGCTPAFDLMQRVRLRDICRSVGAGHGVALQVDLTHVLEEPTAAAFEIGMTGTHPSGRTLVVDAGGGTLDVCILEALPELRRFRLFASGGYELGGDRYTDLIAARVHEEATRRAGSEVSAPDVGLIWQRAETAKLNLSVLDRVRVPLGGIAGLLEGDVELTRDWFERASGDLVERTLAAVTNVYREARFTLDRGGVGDRRAGSPVVTTYADGRFTTISELRLDGDGRQHLDAVFLVGGASRMPVLQGRFRVLFGDLLKDLQEYDIDPVSVVASGLARHQALDSVELQHPNWSVGIELENHAEHVDIPLFEPFSPVYEYGWSQAEGLDREVQLPPLAEHGTVSLWFRQVGAQTGQLWPSRRLPYGARSVRLRVDLFGNLSFTVGGMELYPERPAAPWKVPGSPTRPMWLPPEPKHEKPRIEWHWTPRDDEPG